MAANY
jgi:hypothetical protein